MTTVTREQVLKVLPPLIKNDKEFHTRELATALTKEIGAHIKSDTARYWANQLCLPPGNVLDRRPISAKLFVYYGAKLKTKSKSLSSSFSIKTNRKN